MISWKNNLFKLDTPRSTYLFRVSETGHPEHLYYGPFLPETGDISAYVGYSRLRMPTIVNVSNEAARSYLSLIPLETSAMGKGDLRESAFAAELGESGNTVFDFTYESYRITGADAETSDPLPAARKNHSETLVICLRDRVTDISLELSYTVYDDSDVIVRKSRVINHSGETLILRSLSSLQLDMPDSGFEALTFDGAWIRERNLHRTGLKAGTFSIQSIAGVSSAEHNPLFILRSGNECYLFNLLWSGDHRELAELSPYGTLRVLTGINPATFSYRLAAGESFSTPEAILAYSCYGENDISQIAHDFVRRYISPLNWQGRERPVLLNSWEGMGLDLSEERLKTQIDQARAMGFELFVIDDGWFRKGLQAKGDMGDWQAACGKFPHGLSPICEYIHQRGMLAGIWIEPEMISPDSGLFSGHPDFLVSCPGRTPSPGRDQYILDLSREEVVEIIFKKLEALIGENGFDYVKWDMNRYLADDHSAGVWGPEFRYRWTLGVYRLLHRLTRRFPQLLLEGCASGGGRYDLGMLSYVNQFWGSDNTDVTSRVSIASGTSYGYPQETFGAHVSRVPNGITGRIADYETGFNVNAFGAFGYELDLTRLTDFEREMFCGQISFYKQYRKIFQFGKFTRVSDSNVMIWTSETPDASVILALYLERRMTLSQSHIRKLIVPSCKKDCLYRVTTRRQWITNAQMEERRNGPHRSEEFSQIVPGALLRVQGMTLMPVFLGTDYPENSAYLGDYGSRLFILEEER